MLYLLLATLGAVYIALVLKSGQVQRRSRMVVLATNYLTASLVTGGYHLVTRGTAPSFATVLWGAGAGVFFAVSLLLWMVVIEHAGMGASTAAMRLSVVWPALTSILIFGEWPSLWQGLGIALAFAAIALLTVRSGLSPSALRGSGPGALLALFVASGACGMSLKLFHEWGEPAERTLFLVLIFLSAGVLSSGWVGLRRWRSGEALHGPDLRDGVLFGLGNVVGNGFLLKSLETVPGVVAFPLRDSAVIVLVSLLGVLVWKERPGRLGTAALAAAAGAVVLLAL